MRPKVSGCRRKLLLVATILFLSLLSLTCLRKASSFQTGRVTSIVDGDTCDVRFDLFWGAHTERIRLEGVDAPERGQPFWRESREFLKSRLLGENVTLIAKGSDKYGRRLGQVLYKVDGNLHIVNRDIVSNGLAWWYQVYAPDNPQLASLEAAARRSQIGIWSEARPVPPWEFRNRKNVHP